MKSILELETGEKFEGYNFGNLSKTSGEIVFQTGQLDILKQLLTHHMQDN